MSAGMYWSAASRSAMNDPDNEHHRLERVSTLGRYKAGGARSDNQPRPDRSVRGPDARAGTALSRRDRIAQAPSPESAALFRRHRPCPHHSRPDRPDLGSHPRATGAMARPRDVRPKQYSAKTAVSGPGGGRFWGYPAQARNQHTGDQDLRSSTGDPFQRRESLVQRRGRDFDVFARGAARDEAARVV